MAIITAAVIRAPYAVFALIDIEQRKERRTKINEIDALLSKINSGSVDMFEFSPAIYVGTPSVSKPGFVNVQQDIFEDCRLQREFFDRILHSDRAVSWLPVKDLPAGISNKQAAEFVLKNLLYSSLNRLEIGFYANIRKEYESCFAHISKSRIYGFTDEYSWLANLEQIRSRNSSHLLGMSAHFEKARHIIHSTPIVTSDEVAAYIADQSVRDRAVGS